MNRKFFNLQLFALNVTLRTGDTVVSGTADDDKIVLGLSGDTISNVTINAGAGNDSMEGSGKLSNFVINGDEGNEWIWAPYSNLTLNGGDGDDNVIGGSNSVIDGGDGDDNVIGDSNSVIDGGAGNDSIISSGDNVTVDGGDGDDSIMANGKNAIISAGAGNDNITVTYYDNGSRYSEKITVTSGTGNDTLTVNPFNPIITITDFDKNDVLHLSNWHAGSSTPADVSFPTFAKFTNNVLNIGGTKFYLPKVKNINDYRDMVIKATATENIWIGTNNLKTMETTLGDLLDAKAPYWKVSGTTATYYDGDGTVIATLKGLKKGLKAVNGEISGIDVDHFHNITLSKKVLGTSEVTLSIAKADDSKEAYPYVLSLADDVSVVKGFQTVGYGWKVSGTTANYSLRALSTGYYIGGIGRKIKYTTKDTEIEIAKIEGLPSGCKTVPSGYLVDSTGKSLDINTQISYKESFNYTIFKRKYERNLDGGVTFRYPSAFNSDDIKFSGEDIAFFVKDGDHANADFSNNKITGTADADYIGIGGNISAVNSGAGDDTVATDNPSKTYFYHKASVPTVEGATVNTGAGNDAVYLNSYSKDDVILVGSENDFVSLGGSGHFTDLGAGNDVFYYETSIANSTINGGAGNDTIHVDGASNIIQYTTGDGNDTVYGFNSDDKLQIAAKTYSTSKSGSDLIVKVGTGNITLKDVSAANIETVSGGSHQITWTILGTKATGKIDGVVVATITGLKKGTKTSALTGYGNTIVLEKSALTTTNVKLSGSGNYKLALGEGVTAAEVTEAGWIIDGTKATYKTENSTVGYYLAPDAKSIAYKKAATSKELTTVEGLSSKVKADDLSLSGKVVTINANALGTGTTTISNGYTFKLGTDVTKSATTKASWAIEDDRAEYTTTKITEGYVLSKDKKSITHNDAGGGEMVATIDGLKKGTKANAFSVKNNVITVAKTALNSKNIITLDSEDYTLAIGGGVKKSVTSPEGWYISGTTASYNTEKTTAGYALFDDSKTIEYISEVDGGDTLVKLTGLKARTKATSLSIKNKVVTIDEDAINVKSAMTATAEGYEIKLSSAGKITAKSENMTLTGSSGNDTLLGSKYADVLKGGTGEDYLSGGNGADKIYGDGDDTLIGGLGKDSLYSTAGDNTLTGGSGADEFYFKAGNAIITDYTAGTDKIYLQGTSITKTEVSGKNVVFSTDNGGTITVKNGKNKKITVDDVTQKYSASSSGLFAEDNFVTADNLSQLVENNSVGEFEFNSSENLTQENLITFAEK